MLARVDFTYPRLQVTGALSSYTPEEKIKVSENSSNVTPTLQSRQQRMLCYHLTLAS